MEGHVYDDEHPLEIALAWTLAGAAFGVFLLAKLGAFSGQTPNLELTHPSIVDTAGR